MAKTNIVFNNTSYSIEEASLSAATADLRAHLSNTMNGSGAVIDFGGTSYNVDSAKLTAATNEFVSHLGTIAGSGHKVMVNGVEYGIDSAKVANATASLQTAFGNLASGSTPTPDVPTEERLEGDGAEYYTLAPTALSFRSTAPLNELQEVQINGVTVDPSNYTLEEGSTIVTFPIEYLKTLDVGSYEVAVASDSKTVKGRFKVAAPELNEHGFYYNQPYAAYMDYFGSDVVMFIREDNTMDIMVVADNATEIVTYAVADDTLTITSPSMGELHCTFSADGMEVYNTELGTTLSLNDNGSYAADNDYFYIYKEDLGGYEVNCIDKTKAEYGAIKTGIDGIDTVKLADEMFSNNTNLVIAPVIPNSVTSIGDYTFDCCSSLTSITIPDGVTSISDHTFRACKSLEDIAIPDSVTSIDMAFVGCSNLKSITLPFVGALKDGTENTHFGYIFGAHNYQERSKIPETLKNVVITNVISIGEHAFYGCSSLTSIVIPDSVTSIGDYAFCGCTSLTTIKIPDSVTSIGKSAFSGCTSLTTIKIPDSVTSIGEHAFYGCSSLTSIVIPDSVTSIGDYAFSGCTSLTSIELSDNVTSIGEAAFDKCTNLTSIEIPDSVTFIGGSVFAGCTSLNEIIFKGTINQWNNVTKITGAPHYPWSYFVPATYVQCSDGQVAL